jgi:hypothetical protein
VITKKPEPSNHTVALEEAAEDVEVAVEALEVVAVALASNVERRDISPETALPSRLPATVVVEEDAVAAVEEKDPEPVMSAEKRDITPVIALPSPLVVTEVDVHSVDRDPALATSAEKRDITLATALPSREVVTVVAVLSVDPNPVPVTSAVKKVTSSETAPRKRDPVVPDRLNATPATRWDTCLVTVPRVASPDREVAIASTVNSPDTWPETALKVTPAVPVEEVVSVVATDPPVPVTDADKKVILSLTALSPIPEARRRTKRSDPSSLN